MLKKDRVKKIPAKKDTMENWIGEFVKYERPILEPCPGTFYSNHIFNPTVIEKDKNICMLFRAGIEEDISMSEIGLASSKDGIHFNIYPQPVLSPEYDYEIYGCEDPRIVKFEKTFYLTYVGSEERYNKTKICLATSRDLIHWKKHGQIIPENKFKWDKGNRKAAVIVPEMINDKYIMYFTGEAKAWETGMGIAYSDDLINWYETDNKPIILSRKNRFDSKGVETGPTPIVREDGILLFYNGWDENKTHKTGAILLSKDDPTKILKRTDYPVLEPTKNWERSSIGVTFSEGLAIIDNKYYLYYGAGDKYIGLAISKKQIF